MPDRDLWQGAAEGDLRFQFEVIRQLGESVREQTKVIAGVQNTQIDMLQRLSKIEANRINETVAKLEGRFDNLDKDVEVLKTDKNERDGGNKMRRAVIYWWPAIGIMFTVLFLLFRATGILHLPTDPVPSLTREALPPKEMEPKS